MKRYQKLLFIYSLVFTTFSFFIVLLFAPKPANFIYILLLLPINFYFWLKLAGFGPEKDGKTKVSTGKGVFVFIVLVLIVSSLLTSLGVYLISTKYLENESETGNLARSQEDIAKMIEEEKSEVKGSQSDGNILKELQEIKDELAIIRANQRGITPTTVPGEDEILNLDTQELLDNSTTLGSILVKEPYNRVDAHEEPTASSRVVGSINQDDAYFYSDKSGDWYLVETDQKTKGWVYDAFVFELTGTE